MTSDKPRDSAPMPRTELLLACAPKLIDEQRYDLYPPRICNWITDAIDALKNAEAADAGYTPPSPQAAPDVGIVNPMPGRGVATGANATVPSPSQYRKNPAVIEAIKFRHDNREEVMAWCRATKDALTVREGILGFCIPTLEDGDGEGQHIAVVGDWIIRGVKGEFYPCKPDIFAMTYEPTSALSETAPSRGAVLEEAAKACHEIAMVAFVEREKQRNDDCDSCSIAEETGRYESAEECERAIRALSINADPQARESLTCDQGQPVQSAESAPLTEAQIVDYAMDARNVAMWTTATGPGWQNGIPAYLISPIALRSLCDLALRGLRDGGDCGCDEGRKPRNIFRTMNTRKPAMQIIVELIALCNTEVKP